LKEMSRANFGVFEQSDLRSY